MTMIMLFLWTKCDIFSPKKVFYLFILIIILNLHIGGIIMNTFFKLALTSSLALGLVACSGETEEKTDSVANDTNQTETEMVEVEAGDKAFTITATNWALESNHELVVKKGDNVTINLVNEEGYHGIKLDEFGFSIDGDGESSFTANEIGEYTIYCSVVCGGTEDHEAMKITLKVVE